MLVFSSHIRVFLKDFVEFFWIFFMEFCRNEEFGQEERENDINEERRKWRREAGGAIVNWPHGLGFVWCVAQKTDCSKKSFHIKERSVLLIMERRKYNVI